MTQAQNANIIRSKAVYLAQLDSAVGVHRHLLPPLHLHRHLPLLDVVHDNLQGFLSVVHTSRLGEKKSGTG